MNNKEGVVMRTKMLVMAIAAVGLAPAPLAIQNSEDTAKQRINAVEKQRINTPEIAKQRINVPKQI